MLQTHTTIKRHKRDVISPCSIKVRLSSPQQRPFGLVILSSGRLEYKLTQSQGISTLGISLLKVQIQFHIMIMNSGKWKIRTNLLLFMWYCGSALPDVTMLS